MTFLKFSIIFLLIFLSGCDLREQNHDGYKKYKNETIEFLHPTNLKIEQEGTVFLKGYNYKNEHILSIFYEMILYPSPNYPGMRLYKDNKKDPTYVEIKIGDKNLLISVKEKEKNKLIFSYIIRFKTYSWTLIYYLETDKKPDYYINSGEYPEIPKKIIESAVIKSKY